MNNRKRIMNLYSNWNLSKFLNKKCLSNMVNLNSGESWIYNITFKYITESSIIYKILFINKGTHLSEAINVNEVFNVFRFY